MAIPVFFVLCVQVYNYSLQVQNLKRNRAGGIITNRGVQGDFAQLSTLAWAWTVSLESAEMALVEI